jgi:hypothetical protein
MQFSLRINVWAAMGMSRQEEPASHIESLKGGKLFKMGRSTENSQEIKEKKKKRKEEG